LTKNMNNVYRELAHYAAQLALEKKGLDILLLEVGQVSIVADYFLLGTGNTAVQVHSICGHLLENMKKAGHQALRVDARIFYDLERLWSEAPLVKLDEIEQKISESKNNQI